jgi:hypothetical protein
VIMLLVFCAAIGVIAVRWPAVFVRLWLVLALPWAGLWLTTGRLAWWELLIVALGAPATVLATGVTMRWVFAPLFPRHTTVRSDKALPSNFWRTRT